MENIFTIPLDKILVLKGTTLEFQIVESEVRQNMFQGRVETYHLQEITPPGIDPLPNMSLTLGEVLNRFEIKNPNSVKFIGEL